MLMWTGKSPRGLNPTQKATGMLRVGHSLPQVRAHQLVIQSQMVSSETYKDHI